METKMLHKAILMTKSHKKLSMEYYQDKILKKIGFYLNRQPSVEGGGLPQQLVPSPFSGFH